MYFNNELVNLRRETRRYIRDLEKEKEEGQDEEGQD
jgi:hypothetical protein